ncbi:MAG: hypothetical protein KKC77_19645 [Proteobacteria bacterium]|nr:hypothetical protein [Pseudomonadota bacterium]
MTLFSLDNGRVTYTPEALMIKEFRAIWDKDMSKHKEYAVEEFAYVFYMSDYKSPYLSYDLDARENKIVTDVITKKGWVPGEHIKAAITKYKELQETPSMGLLKDAEMALDKIRYYFRNVDVTDDENGTTTKNLIFNVEKLGGVMKGLSLLRDMVDKEVSENNRMRGDGKLGLRETPRK